MRLRQTFMILGFVVLFAACGQRLTNSFKELPSDVVQNFFLKKSNVSCVVGMDVSGVGLSGAQILIGNKVGVPFQDNYFEADAAGCFQLPANWIDKQNVTIEAPGYIRTTFVNVEPRVRDYFLNLADGSQRMELKGVATGFGELKKDGFIDFALIVPMLSRFQLSQFNIADLLSPETDTISALGRSMSMPSNLSLPKQSENYSILSVKIDKPIYRTFFRKADTYRMVAARGKFPFKEVVKEMNAGKSLFDVLNKMEFLSGGKMDVAITSAATQKDIATEDYILSGGVSVQAPMYAAGKIMLSTLLNLDQDSFIATDVKTLASKEKIALKGIAGATQSVLNLLGTQRVLKSGYVTLEPQISSAFLPASNIVAPIYLNTIAKPIFDGTYVRSTPPTLTTGIAPAGTYAVVSDLNITDTVDAYHEEKTRLWEIYADEWVSEIALPEWPAALGATAQKRLEVSYLGQAGATGVSQSGPQMIESSTHATKNALDF